MQPKALYALAILAALFPTASLSQRRAAKPSAAKAVAVKAESAICAKLMSDYGRRWTNDCRVKGERIIWRTKDVFKGDGPGVWRTRPEDEVTIFRIDGDNVTITTKYLGSAPIFSTYKMA